MPWKHWIIIGLSTWFIKLIWHLGRSHRGLGSKNLNQRLPFKTTSKNHGKFLPLILCVLIYMHIIMQFILIYSLKCVVIYVVLHALQCVIDATPDISNPPEPPNPPNPSDPPTPSTTPLPARQFLGYPIRTTSSPPVYSYTAPWRRSRNKYYLLH